MGWFEWTGFDVPDIAPTAKPELVQPFIMNQEGTARLWVRGLMKDGPFPTHYEPFESPVANVLAPKIRGNPAGARVQGRSAAFGEADEFPYVATSYRLTEHFHFWTKHALINAVLQPEFFVEISEELAEEKGIAQGGCVRGLVEARFRQGEGCGHETDQTASDRRQNRPCRRRAAALGFHGSARKGFGPNSLTPVVGDANTQTPEFKAFLVNIEALNAAGCVREDEQ